MHWDYLLLFFLFLALVGLSIQTVWTVWKNRLAPGAMPFMLLELSAALWALTSGLEKLTLNPATKILLSKIQYLGIVSVPVFWLLFTLEYTRQDRWLTRRTRIALWIIPVITLLLVWTNEAHHLVWSEVIPANTLGLPSIYRHGTWFQISLIYNYLLLSLGILSLIWAILRYPGVYGQQATSLLAGVSIPIFANILYILEIGPIPGMDPTPFALILCNAIYSWSIFRYRVFDLIPVARDAIFDHMLDGILVLDAQNRIIDINHTAQEMLKLSRDSATGHNVRDVLAAWDGLAEVCCNDPESQVHTRFSARDLYLELRSAPLRSRGGKSFGQLIILRDITREQLAEQRLHLQSQALEAAANGIVITDRDGIINWVNPSFTRITGYSVQDALGKTPRVLKSGKHEHEFYQNMWNTLLAGMVWNGELINRRKDGSLYTEEMTISPVYNTSGQVSHFVAIKQDITQRKQTEQSLERANLEKQRLAESEAISQERNRIAQEIHDSLAQNLAALLLRVRRWRKLLQSDPSRIEAEIDEVVMIVNASLVEARRSIFALRPLALQDRGVIPALQEMTQGFTEYYPVRIVLDVRGPERSLPKTLELTLFRIVQEALNNVVKHAQATTAWVILDLSDESAVHLSVRDNGRGFNPATLPEATHARYLGLSGMHTRVEQARGSLEIRSQPGEGTEISVILPT
jgi:PAS domain S-box-containing protein